MSKIFDQGKDEIAKLCKYFATNQQSFLAPGVKEDHVRQSLIDPFFEALGWDVHNFSMTAPQYREVIPEDSLDVEGQQKAPDYTFRVGTLPKFYVEAKKCGVNISADPAPAYQLRRYGFSAKLALSILTDFDELGVYDCASRPRPGDKASHARIQYFGFTEYPDRWREIWDVFSREAVWSGMFDQYAASKRKRGTSEVDSEFLKDIEGWRDVLARNLALRNNDLSADDLNAAVQRIIDRIVFLRMAEDRGLESYGQLLKLCEQPDIYARFMSGLCRKADQKYNSGLFHFQKEPGVSDAPDTLTPCLTVDDKALKPILQSLYFEHGSPYHFGVLPVEILGTVYERFLGKVIRLTAGHQAKVEEKPEVRKAGGVYYTPAYIVNYIVHNTIGKQIEGKSPADLAGGKTTPPFRVLDMACGSGSFLLGAYQFLLDHCLKWHQANLSKKHAKAVYQNAKSETRLTIAERKRILTTHIYGVDIDRQAVETTKLSLLLKALEGENDTTLSQQMTLFHERALPNLSLNIKCGNSLIASDFSMVPEDLVRVRAFDWPTQFPDAMKDGGFDAVVGNPPYRRELDYKELMDEIAKASIGREYRSPRMDLWYYFVHRGLELAKPSGLLSYIVNAYWVSGTGAEKLISTLRDSAHIEEIFFLGKLKVFQNVSGQHMIIRVSNQHNSDATILIKLAEDGMDQTAESVVTGRIPAKTFSKTHQQLFRNEKVDIQPPSGDLLAKIEQWASLITLGIARQGIAENPASINRKTNEKYGNKYVVGQGVFALRPDELEKLRLPSNENKLVHPYHDLRDLGRYYLASEPSLFLIYSTRNTCPDIRKHLTLYEHLLQFKPIMQERRETKNGANSWWHLHWPRDESLWTSPKVISIQMGARPSFTLSTTPVYVPFSVNVFVPHSTTEEHLNYMLGITTVRLTVEQI
ncbi:MAG: N-6 DNA methylase [Pseudomonadota bacterium]